MRNKILGFLLLALTPLASYGVDTGNGMNNGGDAIRQLFENARTASVAILQDLKWCSFKGDAPADKVDWILKNRTAIIKDIKESQHLWVVDNQPTCAVTNRSSSAPIYLSYQTCGQNVGTQVNKAVFVVLHETAHHFGVDNERAADEIAQIIMDAKLGVTCPKSPDITDPNICSSAPMTTADAAKYFTPGSVRATVPMDVKFYARILRCVKLSGCEPWKEWKYASSVQRTEYGVAQWTLDLISTQKAPFFDGQLEARSGSLAVESTSFSEVERGMTFKMPRESHPIQLLFTGTSYRRERAVELNNKTAQAGRLTKDCLWVPWKFTYTIGGGVTETVEVYMHARF